MPPAAPPARQLVRRSQLVRRAFLGPRGAVRTLRREIVILWKLHHRTHRRPSTAARDLHLRAERKADEGRRLAPRAVQRAVPRAAQSAVQSAVQSAARWVVVRCLTPYHDRPLPSGLYHARRVIRIFHSIAIDHINLIANHQPDSSPRPLGARVTTIGPPPPRAFHPRAMPTLVSLLGLSTYSIECRHHPQHFHHAQEAAPGAAIAEVDLRS